MRKNLKFNFFFCLGKLPKNPDAELDAERWLPRRERSYYKGKRRDKRKEISKGPQGAVSANADL